MEISVSWDLSGFKHENVIELVAFALNKEGKCKNKTGVVGSMQPWSEIGISYEVINRYGVNNENDKCLTIKIEEDKVPYYCKEILLFAYNNNGYKPNCTFEDLEFFKVFKNDENIYNLSNKNEFTGLFHICNIVKVNNELNFVSEMKFLNKDLIKLGQEFDIMFNYQS